ncbi:D-alanine--D-alanine ligase [Desulfohalovibrio reitneri]|uniref:D-alanine--D-alanine ligase n=1 Tax=Desulfohalovibrio reitneri TaxID=1307759 RepID=UPI0004A72271|nr:D-alanine--D-alanine ligase [Desulfohalovibrio reitneri]
MRILLIAGGWSNERAVSLSGAERIESALTDLGHEVRRLDPSSEFDELIFQAGQHDFAFLNLHGAPGEDGLIQAMLDASGTPYQGSGPAASFLALHKAAAKQLYRKAGLPTPDWRLVAEDPGTAPDPGLGFPVFLKPNNGGSSLGMSRADCPEALAAATRSLLTQGVEVLWEAEAKGDELTCAVVGDEALPCILIRPLRSGEFFDYQSKYEAGGAEELCPAPIDGQLESRLRELALAAHRALGCSGYSRSDFIVTDEGPLLLETNTLPGMTGTSLVPQSAAEAGMDFESLVERLIELGLEERGR